jgi:predicted TIM-barrel fold metal-dependent hydrolase
MSRSGITPPAPDEEVARRVAAQRGDRYLVVACDSHAGPSLERQLRPYCPQRHLDDFDDYVAMTRQQPREAQGLLVGGVLKEEAKAFKERSKSCPGLQDPAARLRDMDADGVAVDVIFAGGLNDETLPFLGVGFDAGSAISSADLRTLGSHIWNQWLVDFISGEPERHVGVMQIPIWDVDTAVKEIEWGAARGLRAVNLPAPRKDYPSYNEPLYEPLWSVCEALRLPCLTHVAGGTDVLGLRGPGGDCLLRTEIGFFGRRGLWQLIFGGVFERHPGLKLVFTEQRVAWVPDLLQELNSIYLDDRYEDTYFARAMPRLPSDYWFANCYLSGSFLAPYEVEMRHEVGMRNLLWGSDYPHPEGTWPRTTLALRNTFAGIPEDDARMILGDNAVDVYNLDTDALRPVAERIGPRPADLAQPLRAEEFPAFHSLAFRMEGSYS